MTVVFIDPIHGAALTAGLLPILPALPCPTCGGKRWLRAPVPHDEVLPGRSCPDCSDGVWTPPDHPVPIGVTSEYLRNSARYGPWIVCQPVTDLRMDRVTEPWTMFDPRVNGSRINIAQSSVIGEATLRKVPVVDEKEAMTLPRLTATCIELSESALTMVRFIDSENEWTWERADISSALPFLPGLKPDDTVYLLDGFTESVEPIAVPNAPDQPTIWATMSGPGSATNAPGPAHSPSQKRTTR